MRNNRAWALVPVLAVCLLSLASFVGSQEQDKPDWQDALKDAVRDAVEGEGGGQLGRIQRVEVARRSPDQVALSVDLGGTGQPDRVGFEVEVYDADLRAIDGMEVTWGAIPAGDGRVEVVVTYTGGGEPVSVGARLSLVDRTTGRASSRRKVALPWEWRGTGAGGAASTGGLSVRSSEEGPAEREPVIVELDPVRVGDTPAATPLTIQPGQVVATARLATTPTPTPAGRVAAVGMVKPMVAVSQVIDLYADAPKAQWKSERGDLQFGGATGDSRGYARALGRAKLADDQFYDKVLQTHPAFMDGGHISGSFQLTIPAKATRFEASGGFLPGASRSDGVSVTVRLYQGRTSHTVANRAVLPGQGVVPISGEIPEEWRGREATLVLYVQAGGTSTQDWFAWVAPVIR